MLFVNFAIYLTLVLIFFFLSFYSHDNYLLYTYLETVAITILKMIGGTFKYVKSEHFDEYMKTMSKHHHRII